MSIHKTFLIVAVIAAFLQQVTAQRDSCGACNCQFSNIELLNGVIDQKVEERLRSAEARINGVLAGLNDSISTLSNGFVALDGLNSSFTSFASALASQPVVKMMYIGFGGSGTRRSIRFQPRDPATWNLVNPRTDLSIPDTNNPYTSSNNMVAYRPRYADSHNSNLGAVFINLQSLFPCLSGANFHPACSLFTSEEDGFRDGRPIIQAADIGNNFRIFSSTTNFETFGFAFQSCSTISTTCVGNIELDLVCLLPRNRCA